MSIKCNERILRDIQLSLKLTEDRMTREHPLPDVWQPVQHKPIVAVSYSMIIQRQTMEKQKLSKEIKSLNDGIKKEATMLNSINGSKLKPSSLPAKMSKSKSTSKSFPVKITAQTGVQSVNIPNSSKNKHKSKKALQAASIETAKLSIKKMKQKSAADNKEKHNHNAKDSSSCTQNNTNGHKREGIPLQKNKAAKRIRLETEFNQAGGSKTAPIIVENNSINQKTQVLNSMSLYAISDSKDNDNLNNLEEASSESDEYVEESDSEEIEYEDESQDNSDDDLDDGTIQEDNEINPSPDYMFDESGPEGELDDASEDADDHINGAHDEMFEEESGSEGESNEESDDEASSNLDTDESSDNEDNESELTEYSLDSNEDFFTNPHVYVGNKPNYCPLDLRSNVEEKEAPFQMNLGEVDANITKVLVFDDAIGEIERSFNESTEDSIAVAYDDPSVEASNDVEIEDDSNNEDGLESGQEPATQDVEDPLSENFDLDDEMNVNEESMLPEMTVFENSLKTNHVLAVLKQDIELYGTVVATLIRGRVSINGYKARLNEQLTIYSPKGSNWVVISPLPNKKPPKDNAEWNKLNDMFSCAQLNNIMANYDNLKDAIVLLQRNSGAQNMIKIFGKHMAENVFPLMNASNRPNYNSEYLLNCFIQAADLSRALQVPKAWSKLALYPTSRLMATGGKGVGKSTLLRYLVNRHLDQFPRILFIDLDIGQPELFLPQTISCTVVDTPLLGQGLFYNRQPDLAYVVGHVNVVMCAERYGRSVRMLLDRCRANKNYANIPWVINTMGYNKGIGLELMVLLVDCVQPTDVVQIASSRPINNFDIPLDCQSLSDVTPIIYTSAEFNVNGARSRYALHQLHSALPPLGASGRRWLMSAKDVRYATLLARLSAALRGNAKYLTDCQPMEVSMKKLQIVHLPSEDYTRDELIAGMEANLVFLCQCAVDNQPIECFGIGVVRAIDYEAGKLYLLPAMPLARLTKVDCLVLGVDMCLPQGFFKDQGSCVANNVPFVFIIDDSKSSKSIQQIYYRPPGFLGQPANRNV